MSRHGEKNMAITGIGMSAISRGSEATPMALTIDACLAAIEDAGLKRADIDGVSSYPGGDNNGSGFSPVGVPALMDALRLQVDWYSGGGETPGQLGAVFNAIAAICAGYCNHVLVFRTVGEASARKGGTFANALFKGTERAHGQLAEWAPYWALSAAVQQALYFQRYVHDFGARPDQVGWIAVNNRRNASLNPAAVYRTPITIDDYLASPLIATPLRLYDCDVPVDGSVAIIISRRELARDMPNPVIGIEAIGSALHRRYSWSQIETPATQATLSVAQMMWSRTDLTPADLDVAQLYDGFTYHTLAWLGSMGICDHADAAAFVEGGTRIALEGEMPINTGGGQLSAGRLHAYGQLHEACTQLWGRGGERQVPGDVRVSANCTAGGPLAGCMLLVRE
jgi:acetyl-CoA acetyltransferase